MFLPTAYVVKREGYVLTRVCLSVHGGGGGVPRGQVKPGWGVPPFSIGGGYPSQVRWDGGTPARSNGGEVPWPGLTGGTPARSDGGTPAKGYPPAGMGYPPGQVRTGGYPPLAGGTPCQTPQQGVPPWYRTIDGVLDMPRSVCLLRSGRRTFLFK